MYIVVFNEKRVGPFKNYRLAQKWIDATPYGKTGAYKVHVLLEPLAWDIFETVAGEASGHTSSTTKTTSSPTPPTKPQQN